MKTTIKIKTKSKLYGISPAIYTEANLIEMKTIEVFTENLLPCPFCGGAAVMKNYGVGTGGYMISCSNRCGVIMTGSGKNGNYGREKEIHEEIRIAVITNWNKRKT